ncbi:hypothetical protein LCGC14_2985670, partial [marine sediment metagenome]
MSIAVPAKFVTDFASVPWIFQSVIPSWGRYGKAAVIHDYLYQTHRIIMGPAGRLVIPVSRKEADLIFSKGMGDSGTSVLKIKIMYVAVRVFGYWAWRKRK